MLFLHMCWSIINHLNLGRLLPMMELKRQDESLLRAIGIIPLEPQLI